MKDEDATRDTVMTSLDSFLARPSAGDTLILYYTGHGGPDDAGRVYFATHDAGDDMAKTAWPVASILDAVDTKFRGARAWLLADCCSSGALADEARRRASSKGPELACLESSQASESSTGNWTFTQTLLSALRGESTMDADGDGAITLSELAEFAEAELAFVEEQLTAFATTRGFPDLVLAKSDGVRRRRRRVEVDKDERRVRAVVSEERNKEVKVRYVGDDASEEDEWVPLDKVHPHVPMSFPRGTHVEVRWQKLYYPAVILESKLGVHHIHYDDYGDEWDEWVGAERVRVP